jgi:LL-diaminopimelate aminotransferase
VRVCRERDILLVYDNAYSEIAFDGYVPPSIFQIDGARDVAIEFHSLSKTYNMTGWRCGWAVAKPEIASTLLKVKSFVDTGQFMAIQAAGAAALESWAEFVPKNVAIFQARRDAACLVVPGRWLRVRRAARDDVSVDQAPEGIASATFTERLLEEQGVVVMAGSSFGAGGEGFFRISFVQSPARIAEAAQRAGALLSSMTPVGVA